MLPRVESKLAAGERPRSMPAAAAVEVDQLSDARLSRGVAVEPLRMRASLGRAEGRPSDVLGLPALALGRREPAMSCEARSARGLSVETLDAVEMSAGSSAMNESSGDSSRRPKPRVVGEEGEPERVKRS